MPATDAKRPETSPSNRADCSVVPTPREVISDQLLVALDDKSKVAILASESDLDLLEMALDRRFSFDDIDRNAHGAMKHINHWNELRLTFLRDVQQLRQAAFGG